jgi:hypothetical protein
MVAAATVGALAVTLATRPAAAQGGTLAAIQQKYLDKRVIIRDTVNESQFGYGLARWHPAWWLGAYKFSYEAWHPPITAGQEFGYEPFQNLSVQSNGVEVVIVQVQAHRSTSSGSDASNLSSATGTVSDGFVDIIVQFADGSLAATTNYASRYEEWPLVLVEDRDRHAAEIVPLLPSLVGRTLYTTYDSDLYPVAFTTLQMIERRVSSYRQRKDFDFLPPSTPVTIVDAAYDRAFDVVVLRLTVPGLGEALSTAVYRDGAGESFLARIAERFTLESSSKPHDR